jgi:hypothetical protein
MSQSIDAARLTLMLNDLRLPAIKQDWPGFAERADKESWPAARFLATLAEHEIAERDRRRLARHLAEAQLLPGKTLDSFDFDVVPMISKARVMAICAGDSWIDKGANLILILSAKSGGQRQRCEAGYACLGARLLIQPVHDARHVHGGGRAGLLQSGLGQADVAASAQAERTHTLRQRPLDPGTHAVTLLPRGIMHPRSRRVQRIILGAWVEVDRPARVL